jgi:5,10-methylenetetrahydromethanopterin reductase
MPSLAFPVEFWRAGGSLAKMPPDLGVQLEDEGWDGHMVMDSQSLSGDPFVLLGAAATLTTRLLLSPGVTNPFTRELAVIAAAISTVQAQSEGRAVLGIGRGDSALAYLGHGPVPVARFAYCLRTLQALLAGDEVPFDDTQRAGWAEPLGPGAGATMPKGTRLGWLPTGLPKVPIDVAATGPKVIALGAASAERVTLSLGADDVALGHAVELARHARAEAGLDPETLRLGAQVVVIVHDDLGVARRVARPMVASLARFQVLNRPSVSEGAAGADVLGRIRTRYDMTRHGTSNKMREHDIPDEFIDRFAIVGPPDHCAERLLGLTAIGVRHFHMVGAISPPELEAETRQRLVREVFPAVRRGS